MLRPFTIQLFGGLFLKQGDQTITRFRTQKTALLLAYLSFRLNTTHSREELIELLWPDSDLEAGRTSLRTALASLRRQIEPPGVPENSVLLADRNYIRLNPEIVYTDVAAFEEAIKAARKSDIPGERGQRLREAVSLYQGPLLPGFYDDWALRERERLEQLFLSALRELAQALEGTGDLPGAIDALHRVVNTDPLQEEAQSELMRLYAASGQIMDARRQYAELKRILQRELGASPAAETQALAESLFSEPRPHTVIARAPEGQAEPPSPSPPRLPAAPLPDAPEVSSPPRLPLILTRFFGRDEEIARLENWLRTGETRLITLTGPGGSGKTRLAVELARRLSATLAGVCFTPLADITDPRLITGAILDALCVPRAPETDPLEQILKTIQGKAFLLVLDNFEQLVEEGAAILWTLLERAPTLVCLVTSRHRLDIGGEREYPVIPLPVPTMPGTPERLMEFASIRLFLDRAQAARPDFQITRENAATVAALCERLEGMPLAIELAAAWVGTLTVSQILVRLAHRFDLLTSRRKDLSARHRTLRAAIEWSYRLLPAELQPFFVGLSVFRGGWTLEAAEAVCAEPRALEYLPQLRERSLILAEETPSGMWFRLMETLREYAGEQLSEETRKTLKTQHLRFFLRFATEAQSHLHGPEQARWLEALEQQHDNLRAALEWSREEPAHIADGLRLASHLHFFWHVRGHLAEGYRWLTDLLGSYEAIHVPSPSEPMDLHLLAASWQGAGELAYAQAHLPAARKNLEAALALWKQTPERKGVADTYCFLGLVTDQENHVQATALYAEALTDMASDFL